MKKVVFSLALSLVVLFAFGQKKAVNMAKNEILATAPNIGEARSLIKGAIANPETENNAETWFIAGKVEDKQFGLEQAKEIIGQQPDDAVMFSALVQIYPYFEKAFTLDNIPNEKGKIKAKYTKDMRAIMMANRPYYINAGAYFYEKEDYQKAYENFRFYGDFPNLPLFEGDTKTKFESLATDTNAVKYRYYAALSASFIPNHDAAIELYAEIKDCSWNESDIYRQLAGQYSEKFDTVNFVRVLEQGVTKFPTENYFLLNLININLTKGETQSAITYLSQAIELMPDNAALYDALGVVYENTKVPDKAIENITKALEIEPDNADYLSHLGRMYYNLGVETRALADDNMKNANLYEQYEKQYKDYFNESIPYFEKAYKLNSEDRDAVFALRNMYYSLGKNVEYEKWDKIYSGE
ncbi:MAG: hypothetical protein LBS25_05340 [Candidatus Symbiothrix sp.]|jgi:tetratricopeptide (TPR) repeat protein|nr:hypothetical protein [Candidatus Symbiothrix sp.]